VKRCIIYHKYGFHDDSTKKEEVETMFHKVEAMVLFVGDLDKCMTFYQDILGLQMTDRNPDSVGFSIGGQYFLLLKVSAAAHMVSEEALELKIEGGPRGFLAAGVEDVDVAYEALKAKGVTFLRSPTNQSWGLRTAYFADPEGNLWEINQPLESKPEG
jgi:lactoylglutathione lyase